MSPKPTSADLTSEQCAAKLMETIPSVMQFFRAEMRRNSSLLSVPQFRTLAFLSRYPGASLSQLAEHLGVTRATASALTERLVQRDLVKRTEHPQERRQVVLNLTQSGAEHLEKARAMTRDKTAYLLNSLTPEQLDLLMQGLTVLGTVFNETFIGADVDTAP